MTKAIGISILTFFVCLFIEASISAAWNIPGMGILAAVTLMGGFILGAIEKQKEENDHKNP